MDPTIDAEVVETFQAAKRRYRLALQTTEGTGEIGERYVIDTYNELKKAAEGHPSLMKLVPPSAAPVSRDGLSGASGGLTRIAYAMRL